MAERANPDHPGFQNRWIMHRRLGVPYPVFRRSAYRSAVYWRYRWVSRYAGNRDVLDIPSGMGWGTSLIRGARSIVGVDISAEAIGEAMARYARNPINFAVGEMAALAFADQSFDLVACLEGIEHVSRETARLFLVECRRLLRQDGLLMLSSPYCRTGIHSGNPYHLYEYQPNEIQTLVEEGFAVESVTTQDVDIMTVLYLCCRKKSDAPFSCG